MMDEGDGMVMAEDPKSLGIIIQTCKVTTDHPNSNVLSNRLGTVPLGLATDASCSAARPMVSASRNICPLHVRRFHTYLQLWVKNSWIMPFASASACRIPARRPFHKNFHRDPLHVSGKFHQHCARGEMGRHQLVHC